MKSESRRQKDPSTGRSRGSKGAPAAYVALADELRAAIIAGEFPEDVPLPTEAELVEERGLSRQTVRQAYGRLVAEGYVYRVRGRGSFAMTGSNRPYLRSFGSVGDLLSLSVDTELEVITPLERRADAATASRLQLNEDNLVAVTFKRLHHGAPFAVTTAYLPEAIGAALADVDFLNAVGGRGSETIIGLVEEHAQRTVSRAIQSTTAVRVPSPIAEHLECEAGNPALRIDRIYFDRSDIAIELAISHFNPRRYSHRLELRRGH